MSLDLFSWFTFLIDAFPGPNMPISFPHKHQRMISIHMDKSMLTDGASTPNTISPHNVTWTNVNIITFTLILPLSLPPTHPPLPPSLTHTICSLCSSYLGKRARRAKARSFDSYAETGHDNSFKGMYVTCSSEESYLNPTLSLYNAM